MYTHIIGIDEAGRGPLAGPVSVGLVLTSTPIHPEIKKELRKIKGKDSKKLSHEKREMWFEKLQIWKQEGKINFYVSLISAKIIDSKGISYAIQKAMKECLDNVNADCKNCKVLLDGSLHAPQEFVNQKTIIKGDEKEPLISLASIAAKVTRDRYMAKIARKFPVYNFEIHKGYGTLSHRKLIQEHGITALHRTT
ncbi:ribonuclease HII, partial [Patescibacteria group bacterium]|nr:ribonuclease HII [Patescibacteria group bacterium]